MGWAYGLMFNAIILGIFAVLHAMMLRSAARPRSYQEMYAEKRKARAKPPAPSEQARQERIKTLLEENGIEGIKYTDEQEDV